MSITYRMRGFRTALKVARFAKPTTKVEEPTTVSIYLDDPVKFCEEVLRMSKKDDFGKWMKSLRVALAHPQTGDEFYTTYETVGEILSNLDRAEYQRPIIDSHVANLKSLFDREITRKGETLKTSPVSIAYTVVGEKVSKWILDGQHRLKALEEMKRFDIYLPVQNYRVRVKANEERDKVEELYKKINTSYVSSRPVDFNYAEINPLLNYFREKYARTFTFEGEERDEKGLPCDQIPWVNFEKFVVETYNMYRDVEKVKEEIEQVESDLRTKDFAFFLGKSPVKRPSQFNQIKRSMYNVYGKPEMLFCALFTDFRTAFPWFVNDKYVKPQPDLLTSDML